MTAVDVPEHHYTGLGRVVVAAGVLEAMISEVVAARTNLGDAQRERLLASAGAAIRSLDALAKETGDDKLREFHKRAKDLLEQRNRLVHSLVVLDMPTELGASSKWVLRHPRTNREEPLPPAEEYAGLARQLQLAALHALSLARPADFVRTEEVQDE